MVSSLRVSDGERMTRMALCGRSVDCNAIPLLIGSNEKWTRRVEGNASVINCILSRNYLVCSSATASSIEDFFLIIIIRSGKFHKNSFKEFSGISQKALEISFET